MLDVSHRCVDPDSWGERFLALFAANGESDQHSRAVLAEDAKQLWIAEAGGVVVGGLIGRPLIDPNGDTRGGVDELIVASRWRGRGIGRALMALTEAYYRGEGLAGMQLMVGADNASARALYDSLGYETVETRLLMCKSFDQPAR